MKFLKKNKSTIVAVVVFILVLILIFGIKSMFTTDEANAIYGTRLDGREKVEISNQQLQKVKQELEADATSVSTRIAGRIINIAIKTSTETSVEDAKKLGDKAVEKFSSEEKEYYDIQILIENDGNAAQFPIIGYKHHTKDKITWTKDRAGN